METNQLKKIVYENSWYPTSKKIQCKNHVHKDNHIILLLISDYWIDMMPISYSFILIFFGVQNNLTLPYVQGMITKWYKDVKLNLKNKNEVQYIICNMESSNQWKEMGYLEV